MSPQLVQSSSPPRRLLIVLLGAIGDVVRGLPLAQRIRRAWPECSLAWAVEPASAPLLEKHPAIDRVLVFHRGRGLAGFADFLREVRALAPDVTLDLQRHLKSGLTSFASRAPRRVGFHYRNSREGNRFFNNESIPPVDRFTAKIEHYFQFADHLGLPPAPVDFGLRLTDDESVRVDELLQPVPRPFAAMFVGASWPSKLWHVEPAAAVLDRLGERGLAAVVVGGPGDAAVGQAVLARTASRPLNLVGTTRLRDLIGIFRAARVAVGPDSGPMHIAAAVGCPVISLFGATSPERSGPYGFDHLVLEGEAPCRPCYKRRCPIGRLCMETITAERVLAQVDRVLAAAPAASEG